MALWATLGVLISLGPLMAPCGAAHLQRYCIFAAFLAFLAWAMGLIFRRALTLATWQDRTVQTGQRCCNPSWNESDVILKWRTWNKRWLNQKILVFPWVGFTIFQSWSPSASHYNNGGAADAPMMSSLNTKNWCTTCPILKYFEKSCWIKRRKLLVSWSRR